MKKNRLLTLLLGFSLLLAATSACNRVATIHLDPDRKTIYSIQGTASLGVKALDSSGKPVEKPKIKWTSADEAIVKVSETGELTGLAPGETTVTAESGKAKAEATVRVVALAKIKVSPEAVNLVGPVGSAVQFQATLLDDQGVNIEEKVKWTSSAPGVASVAADGVVTARAPGQAAIVASLENVKGEARVAVDIREITRIVIHPETTILRVNESQPFSATVYDENSNAIPNAAVAWTTSNKAIASVDPNGNVRGGEKGSCTITATFSGKTAASTVIVN